MDREGGQSILVTEELLPDLLGRHVLLVPSQPVSHMEEQSDKKTSETKENTNSQASENEVNKIELNKTEIIKTEVIGTTEPEKVATEEFNNKEENNVLDKGSCDHPKQALETAFPETSCNDSKENSDVLESNDSKDRELEVKLDSSDDHPIIEKEVKDGSFDAKEEKTLENNIIKEKEQEEIKLETVANEKETEKIEDVAIFEHSNSENSNEKNAESKTVEESKQSDSKQDVTPPEELIVVDILNNAADLESNDSPREEKVFDSMNEKNSEESEPEKEPKKFKKETTKKISRTAGKSDIGKKQGKLDKRKNSEKVIANSSFENDADKTKDSQNKEKLNCFDNEKKNVENSELLETQPTDNIPEESTTNNIDGIEINGNTEFSENERTNTDEHDVSKQMDEVKMTEAGKAEEETLILGETEEETTTATVSEEAETHFIPSHDMQTTLNQVIKEIETALDIDESAMKAPNNTPTVDKKQPDINVDYRANTERSKTFYISPVREERQERDRVRVAVVEDPAGGVVYCGSESARLASVMSHITITYQVGQHGRLWSCDFRFRS